MLPSWCMIGFLFALMDTNHVSMEPVFTKIPHSAPVYSITAFDMDNDGSEELLIGDTANNLTVQKINGTVLWTAAMSGLPYRIIPRPADRSVLVLSMDEQGSTFLFDSAGHLVARYADGFPLTDALFCSDGTNEYIVASRTGAANHSSDPGEIFVFDHQLNLVRRFGFLSQWVCDMQCGDLNGDGSDEILIGYKNGTVVSCDLLGNAHWQQSLINWPLGSLLLRDLNQDGRMELIVSASSDAVDAVKVYDHNLQLQFSISDKAKNRNLMVGDYDASQPGLELAVFNTPNGWFSVWSSTGTLLFRQSGIDIPSSCGSSAEVDGFYASSVSFRDPAFYRISFDGTRSNMDQLIGNDEALRNKVQLEWDAVNALSRAAQPQAKDFQVIVSQLVAASKEMIHDNYTALQAKELDQLGFVMKLRMDEEGTPGSKDDDYTRTQAEILQVAEYFESNSVPFVCQIGNINPSLSLETAELVLQIAPDTCRGFMFAETFIYPWWKWNDLVSYIDNLCALCKEYGGRKVFWADVRDSMAVYLTDSHFYDSLLAGGKYRDNLVLLPKSNGSLGVEQSTAAIAGLWRSGLISDWGVAVQNVTWVWNHMMHQPFPYDGDMQMRSDLAPLTMGASYLFVEGGMALAHNGALNHFDDYLGVFRALVDKNILLPQEARNLYGYSPVVFCMHRNPVWEHDPFAEVQFSEALSKGLFGTTQVCMQTPHETYAFKNLYGLERFGTGTTVPSLPYGQITMIPAFGNPEQAPFAEELVHADIEQELYGDPDWIDRFASAAQNLPFRAANAFLSVQKHPNGEVRLFLIDSASLSPSNRTVELEVNVPGVSVLEDMLSGAAYSVSNGVAQIPLNGGSITILRADADLPER